MGKCNHLVRKEIILKKYVPLSLNYQTIGTMDPKKQKYPQESHAGRRKGLGHRGSQKRNLSPGKFTPCQLALPERRSLHIAVEWYLTLTGVLSCVEFISST